MGLTKEDRIKLRNMLLYIADCMVAVNDMQEMHNSMTVESRIGAPMPPKSGRRFGGIVRCGRKIARRNEP